METIEDSREAAVEDTEAGDQETSAAAAPSKPRSWSSMVKSDPVAPSQTPAAREGPKEGTPFSGASQPSSAGDYQRGSSQGPGRQGPQGGQRPERFSKEENIIKSGDNQRLFVGNLPQGCTEKELTDLFSKFGRVLESRIHQRQGRDIGRDGLPIPNFGFIVFEDTASVQRTLSAKPILLYGNHR